MSNIKARGWQKAALRDFTGSDKKHFLLEATPGAGKTIFSGLCAKHLLESNYSDKVDFVIAVVPTTALKGDRSAGFLGDWHKVGVELNIVLKEGKSMPKDFNGAVITYQQLPNIASTFETWARLGKRLFFVFDEIHHASDTNTWGSAVERCGAIAQKVLCMTGTPFRGDKAPISFVNYDEHSKAKPDHKFTYREAVANKVCRPVLFVHDDGVAEYYYNGDDYKVKISESDYETDSKVAATVFRDDSTWLETVITKADAKLDEYRATDLDAGGIVICRPGGDDNDDRHLKKVANTIRRLTGDRPIVVTHDDPDANAKIEAFRKSSDRWICSVRKISEGVDIKRLRVLVMATKPGTHLLFRQITGRVVRWEDQNKPEDATVYIASFPQLKQWAQQIQGEAEEGLKEQKEKGKANGPGRDFTDSDFRPIDSSHESDGAISVFGEQYTHQEIVAAESVKRGDPMLSDISVAAIAHIFRKQGIEPDADETTEPKQLRKLKLRKKINKRIREIAIKLNPSKPDFKGAYFIIHKQFGISSLDDLFDNHSIETMQAVSDFLEKGGVENGT